MNQALDNKVKAMKQFIRQNYYTQYVENIKKHSYTIYIKFNDIAKFDPGFADELLEDAEENLKVMSVAAESLDVERPNDQQITIRVTELPASSEVSIWGLRQQFTKFIKIKGIFIKPGEILLRPEKRQYECPACGSKTGIIRTRDFEPIKEMKKCGCGRKGGFMVVSEELRNYQKIIIEEDIMEIGKRQIPKSKMILLLDDLTKPLLQSKLLMGQKIIVNGYLKTKLVNNKGDALDTFMLCNSIEFEERGWDIIKTTEQEDKEFDVMAKDSKLLPNLKQSIMPTIHGNDDIKEALLYQLFGAENVYDDDGFLEERGTINIAVIGNPGLGKSYMAKRMQKFWPIYKYTSAITANGRGLIAAVVRDTELDKYVLVSGTIPMCNKGLNAIDELDKMDKEEYGWLNNAMNDLQVHIDKVVHGRVETDTSIFATLNPIGRKFIESGTTPIYDQINLPADLLDRFDIIFPMKAQKEEGTQHKVFDISLLKRQNGTTPAKKEILPIIPEEKVIKYVASARRIKPVINEDVGKILKKRVFKFTHPKGSQQIEVSNRIYGVIFRLIEASARIHRRVEVSVEDINNAMTLLIASYKAQGLLTEEGIYDYVRMERINETESNIHLMVKKFVREREKEIEKVPVEDVVKHLDSFDTDKVEGIIDKMVFNGEMYNPTPGYLRLI